MHTQTPYTRLVRIAACFALSTPAAALAQNALDAGQRQAPSRPPDHRFRAVQPAQDGQALDANLRVGGGGVNPTLRDARRFADEIAFRNALVTGNVAAGRSFRGDVGYTAVDDFRGATAADTIFGFQRDSAYSGLATQNVRGLSALQFQMVETTGGQTRGIGGDLIVRRDATGATAAQAAGTGLGAEPQSSIDPYGAFRGSLRSTSDFYLRSVRFPRVLGTITTEEGRPGMLTASSLQGVKGLPMNNSLFSRPERPDLIPGAPDLLGRAGRDQQSTDDDPHDDNRLARSLAVPGGAINSFESHRLSLMLRADAYLARPFGGPASEGEQPARADPPSAGEDRETAAQRFDRMIDEMRRTFMRKHFPEEPPADTARPFDDLDPDRRSRDEERERPLTGEELMERAKALLAAREDRLSKFLEEQGATDLYSWHMISGETALEEGRWFEAEERFSSALRVKPGDPMAAAARVHAQIGGSLFISAAANLRNLFTAYPEMIAARFEPRLFLRGERLDAIRAVLRDRLRLDTPFGVDAALLLAYIGHQTGSADDLRDASDAIERLQRAGIAEPDPLERVLREVWGAPHAP